MRCDNATRRRRYYRAVVLTWAIKYFDFQMLTGLWLAVEVVDHVGFYEYKAAKGFSAFQRRFWYCLLDPALSLWNVYCTI